MYPYRSTWNKKRRTPFSSLKPTFVLFYTDVCSSDLSPLKWCTDKHQHRHATLRMIWDATS